MSYPILSRDVSSLRTVTYTHRQTGNVDRLTDMAQNTLKMKGHKGISESMCRRKQKKYIYMSWVVLCSK